MGAVRGQRARDRGGENQRRGDHGRPAHQTKLYAMAAPSSLTGTRVPSRSDESE